MRVPSILVTCLTCLTCLLPSISTRASELDPPSRQSVRWSLEVLLGSEFNNSLKSHTCRRWVFSPTLSAYSPNPAHHQLTREIVAQLNTVLAQTPIKQIRLLPPNDYRANIKVHFVPLAHFPKLSRELGFQYVDNNLGVFWLNWNKRFQITRSTVLLATDHLEGQALRHFACEEITQSLGLPNDSRLFRNSIFYAGDFKKGDTASLTPRDIHLIHVLYNQLAPGDSRQKIIDALTRPSAP